MSTETKISHELDLLDDTTKVQVKMDEQTETINQQDLQKSSDDVTIENDDQITSDNENVNNLLKKIKIHEKNCKEQTFDGNILIDEWKIFNEFFNLVEEHEKTLTDEDRSLIRKVFYQFTDMISTISIENVLSADKDSIKKIFSMYSNLNSFNTIKNYLGNGQLPGLVNDFYYHYINRIVGIMEAACNKSNLAFIDEKRPTGYIELLSLMLNIVKTDLESPYLDGSYDDTCTIYVRWNILGFIWSYSEKVVTVPDLIEAGCVEIIIRGLSIINETREVDFTLKKQLINIINNISRHDEGSKQLNDLNTIDEIKTFQNNNDDSNLDTLCFMILTLLSSSEPIENYGDRMNNLLDNLLEKFYHSSSAFSSDSSSNCHLSEPLIVLAKLSNDERSLNYMMEHTQTNLQFFINSLTNYYPKASDTDPLKQAAVASLVHILWRASFQDKYEKILRKNYGYFKELIQNLAEEPDKNIISYQYVPKYLENIQKSAQELLNNINVSFDTEIKQDNEQILQNTATEQTVYRQKPIEQWNKDDISRWFENSGIRTEFQDLCRFEDGDELLNYTKIFLDTEKLQYQMYSDEFSTHNGITSGKSPLLLHEFTKFSTALQKLEKLIN